MFRRPLAQRAQDIGIWYEILVGIGKISVIVNVSKSFTEKKFVFGYWHKIDVLIQDFIQNFLSFFICYGFFSDRCKIRPQRSCLKCFN